MGMLVGIRIRWLIQKAYITIKNIQITEKKILFTSFLEVVQLVYHHAILTNLKLICLGLYR